MVGGICPACVAKTMQRDFFSGMDAGIEEKEPLSINVQGYEVQELIGGGGMGEVYRAVLTARGKMVAMKVVAGRLTRDPEVTARFEAEVAAMSQLDHENVVHVLDHGETANGRHFLVMEYVDGCDLRRLLRAQKLETERALDIFLKVCAGVAHAHERGLVHRDIKPANILIGADGTVKVADFGLAKTLVENSSGYGFTQTRDTFGTPYYVAPEVTRSAGCADGRADIYALGVLLYELLTGAVPMGQFTPLSQKTGLSKKIDAVINHALADDPKRRLTSVAEMAATVEKIIADHQRGTAKKLRSRRVMAAAAVLAMVGVGAAVGAWVGETRTAGQEQNKTRATKAGTHPTAAATAKAPWLNSLGMKFIPVASLPPSLLVCQHETRVQDFEAFARTGYKEALTELPPAPGSTMEQPPHGPPTWRNPGFEQTPLHPACGISQVEAKLFCTWLTEQEQKKGWLGQDQHYRLPTDAEWSAAAGLANDPGPDARPALSAEFTALPAGNFAGPEARRHPLWPPHLPTDAPEDAYPTTAPVGSYPANAAALFDMSGNVAEWTSTRATPRRGLAPDAYCLRGGSWATGRMTGLLPETRLQAKRALARPNFGFRILLDQTRRPEQPRPLSPLGQEN